jgi:hypothetical protein
LIAAKESNDIESLQCNELVPIDEVNMEMFLQMKRIPSTDVEKDTSKNKSLIEVSIHNES